MYFFLDFEIIELELQTRMTQSKDNGSTGLRYYRLTATWGPQILPVQCLTAKRCSALYQPVTYRTVQCKAVQCNTVQ